MAVGSKSWSRSGDPSWWPSPASPPTASAFGERKATVGEQPERWGTSRVFVVPNPSGLNAHDTVDSLAAAYAAAARAAGVIGTS